MELEQARTRIAELEAQVTALTGERDTLTSRASELEAARSALDARLAGTTETQTALASDLTEAQTALSAASGRELANLRRALLAEQAGQVVPELVRGDDEATLLASVEIARQAYTRALEAARATLASQTVPAGAPSARTFPTAGLSPLEMIESGLRR